MKQQMLEKEVAQLRQDLLSGKPMYKVGESYKTISGDTVLIAGKGSDKTDGTSYETVYWRDSKGNKCHHYNRRDYGRVTGTSCIDQDPRCLVPLWKDYVAEYLRAKDCCDKLKQQVIDLINQNAELIKEVSRRRDQRQKTIVDTQALLCGNWSSESYQDLRDIYDNM